MRTKRFSERIVSGLIAVCAVGALMLGGCFVVYSITNSSVLETIAFSVLFAVAFVAGALMDE